MKASQNMNEDKGERLSRKVIYKNPWINLYVDKVRLPTGHILPEHHFLEFGKGSVCAVMEDSRKRILLIRLYRYPTDSMEWELPAGRMEEGETPLEAVQREVLEETGYRAVHYEALLSYYPVNGISNHRMHLFRCQAAQKAGSFDPHEVSEVCWYEKDEIVSMIRSKKIMDGLSLTGLLYYLQFSPQ